MMAGQSVLCIVFNDLTFFLLFGCRRKSFFSLSNSYTACHFHSFLHTHKHTHTLFGLVKIYTFFMFFMSRLPSQLLLRVLGIHGRKLFPFYSFYFCICTCTHTHFVVLKRNVYISVFSRPWCREKKNSSFFQVLFVLLFFFTRAHDILSRRC